MRIFLKINTIAGDTTLKGFESQIELESFQFEANQPFDASTGLPSGAVRPKRLTATKKWDRSSPLLANALVQHANLGTITFSFVQEVSPNSGKKPLVLDVANAFVGGINEEAASGGATPVEQVLFDFNKLDFRFTVGATTSIATLTAASTA